VSIEHYPLSERVLYELQVFGGSMGETRDRGVVGSDECIQQLKEAQSRQRNAEGKVWTLTDIAIESGVDAKTVSRFLNRTKVDETTAIAICQALGEKFEDVIDRQDTEIEPDRTGQLSMNPFIYGDPVPPEKFYGRRQAILEVRNRIGAIASQSVNIVGLRRIGKTSLLRYIRSNPTEFIQPERQPLIVSLDLQSNPVSTPAGIVEGLRRGIMREQGKEPWKQDENEDDWAVQDGLEALCDRGVRLIVMLDEFEAIASRLEEFQGWGEDWRSKASTQGLFSLVVASKRPISEMYQDLGLTSPFGNIFSTTILGGLEREAWQMLVRDGFAGSKVSEATLDWIDELAGGLPLYVQMAAALLWQEGGDLMRAEAAFRMQAEPRLRELWQGLSEVERGVVRQLGDGDRAVMEQLQRYGVIRADGGLFSRVFEELVRGQK
jgi:transcriptional regulator with XRE-family HTH domain